MIVITYHTILETTGEPYTGAGAVCDIAHWKDDVSAWYRWNPETREWQEANVEIPMVNIGTALWEYRFDDDTPGDAIRIVTRNQWTGIRDVRRYQWADILVGGETPAWGHVGLDVFADWNAATAAQLLYTQADRTSTTWEYGGISNKLTITPNPGWEWGEVAVYNTLTWTPITDRIRVEFL